MVSDSEGFCLESAEIDTGNVVNKISSTQIFPATFVT